MRRRRHALIVSPALKAANNGSWQTAYRWASHLRALAHVSLAEDYRPSADPAEEPDGLIAIGARASALAIGHFADAFRHRPLAIVLTGLDLYRDLQLDPQTTRSVERATHLVVPQDRARIMLGPGLMEKTRVIFPSARTLKPGRHAQGTFDAILVGHMHPDKDPLTAMLALEHLPPDSPVRLIHVGAALDEGLLHAAQQIEHRRWGRFQRYRWLGPRPHGETRERIRSARILVQPSLIEGGANVVVEALTSGVPVLASHIPGNIGLLGESYPGYFAPGDSIALARLLQRAATDADWLAQLARHGAERAPHFAGPRERSEVGKLWREMMRMAPAAD